MTAHDPHDGRAGSLVAQALGDALGSLVEGHGPDVCAPYASEVFSSDDPPARRRWGFAFGQYSDDTQLARELALSLAATRRFVPEDFGACRGALRGRDDRRARPGDRGGGAPDHRRCPVGPCGRAVAERR
jgi:ADP-ribosylglycohydrolase